MSKKLRWGILGVAKINDRLLPAFAKAANAELVGIASRSLDKAQAAAKAAGIPKAFGSYEALLDDPAIDADLQSAAQHAARRMDAQGGRARQTCAVREAADADGAAKPRRWSLFASGKKIKLMDGFMWPHHPRTAQIARVPRQAAGIGARSAASPGRSRFRCRWIAANIRLQAEHGRRQPARCRLLSGLRHPLGVRRGAGRASGRRPATQTASMSR